MGIKLEPTAYPGCYRARIEDVATYAEHGALIARVEELIRDGSLTALLVDARRAVAPERDSFSRTIWDDAMSVLSQVSLAYMAPADLPAERMAMIRTVIADWDGTCEELQSDSAAEAWCRAQGGE